jgi:lysozyme
MKISTNGLKVKKYFESCKLQAYPDPGSKDGHPWTIGWGHTGQDVFKGLVWTQKQADAALVKDAERFERDVESLVKIPINQNQFDALVCFAFNVGSDIDADNIAEGLGDSTLLKMLNSGNFDGAAAQFLRWNKNDGKVMLGLARRRLAEKYLFEGHDADYCIARAQELI